VIFIGLEILQLFVAQIDGKLLVHGDESTGRIVNFLRESGRVLIRIDFFDVERRPPARPANSRTYLRPPSGNSSQCLNFRSFCARDAIAPAE